MASTKQERMLTKSQEAAQARNFVGSSGQFGVSSSTSRRFSSHIDQYNSVGQKPPTVHLTAPSMQPRPPSPPPEYEESPFRLTAGTNMNINVQAIGTPVREDPVQPKEFVDEDHHHRDVGKVKSSKRRRKGIIAIIIIANVVILCAVLGGVLGSMAGKRASSNRNSGTPSGQSIGGGYESQVYASTSSPTVTPSYFSSSLSSSSFVPPATVTATITVGQNGTGGGDQLSIGHAGIPEGTPGAAGNGSPAR